MNHLIAVRFVFYKEYKNVGAIKSARYSRFDVVSNCADNADTFSGLN